MAGKALAWILTLSCLWQMRPQDTERGPGAATPCICGLVWPGNWCEKTARLSALLVLLP